MKLPTSCQGRAAWWSTRAILFGSARRLSRCPLQRAEFSPTRNLLTVDQSRMFSILLCNRVAVSVFSCQIGCSTLTTKAVSIAATGRAPMSGLAYVAIVLSHCAACFLFLHPPRCAAIYSLAQWSKVTVFARSSAASSFTALRASSGSIPSSSEARHSFAFSRACAKLTVCRAPRPISRCLPANRKRKIQLFVPAFDTCRYKPAPSL